ncbi:LytTr DNA-binding domain-containing protein [Spirosoma oryzae]|uniref:LytTr DNA-binding domain-containing protein n=1 Tax=Spirosoma oryzae TaxID=1469603 RepID=A0A2T0S581_9BACT|nr:LytTR family DNA-binding domain-containing protein [Spirosoma oryzae]PRY28552.1 LytTr DNA-binding domain-containing protein [Spirosoma oryzae]
MSTPIQLADCVFVITSKQRYEKITKESILFIQAEGAWVDIVTTAQSYRLATNLGTIEQQVDDVMFCRVSRKHIVNLHRIDSLRGNELSIRGHPILIGRHYRENLLSRLPILQTRLTSASQ